MKNFIANAETTVPSLELGIGNEEIGMIVDHVSDLFTSLLPLILLVVGVFVGLFIVTFILNAIRGGN